MRRAISLAARGLGTTSPNPVVGCVVLDRDGRAVGEGWHTQAGGPHAEVVALSEAGIRARGGTAVVSLEPCAHVGRTPACTEGLSEAGIARVVYAVDDPDPIAAGGGEVLRSRGIDVEGGVLAAEAEAVNIAWLTATRLRRPFVTLKLATTLDGRISAPDGSSRWITSGEARDDAQRLRSHHDAIVVGMGTVIADDPHLTVRLDATTRMPVRIAMGMREVPQGAHISDDAAPFAHVRSHDPRDVLAEVSARGGTSLLVEGGAQVSAAFLRAGLVDSVVVYVAPLVLGGGRQVVGDLGVSTLAGALELEFDDVTALGPDIRISGRPRVE